MDIKALSGRGVDNLLKMLAGQHDEEHEKIVTEVTSYTSNQLNILAGNDKMRVQYVHDLWNGIMKALHEAEIETDKQGLPEILHIIAYALEMKTRLHMELHEKRQKAKNEKPEPMRIVPVDKM